MGRKQVGTVYTSLYMHVGKVRILDGKLGCQRGEASGEGWPVGGVRGQSVGSKGQLESPSWGKAADRKQEIIREELHPYHVLPVLFPQWKVM